MPDHFEGNEADLSDLIVETLALAVDPYPRAPGESSKRWASARGRGTSPFAALKSAETQGKS